MPQKPFTFSEQIAGRRIPKRPSHRDTILAGFINSQGETKGSSNPVDSWLMSPFKKIRQEGLIRIGMRISFGGRAGKNDGIWYLRDGERPIAEALAARQRIDAYNQELKEWGEAFKEGYRIRNEQNKILERITPRFDNREAAEEWLKTEEIVGFGGMTGADLIREGHADWLDEYIDAVDAGVYA